MDDVEYVDAVDAEDKVLSVLPRARLKETGSNYRVVHVLLQDSRGRVLIQKLAAEKARGFAYGSSVAGHVQAGESYAAAARRECREELGFDAGELRALGTTWLDDGAQRKFIGVFVGRADGPFHPDANEVESTEFAPVAEVRRWLRTGERSFSPTFERVFRFADAQNIW